MSCDPIHVSYSSPTVHFKSLFLSRSQTRSGPQHADSGFDLLNKYASNVYAPLCALLDKTNPWLMGNRQEIIHYIQCLLLDVQWMTVILSLGKFKMHDVESLQKYKRTLTEILPKPLQKEDISVDYRLYEKIMYIRERTYKPLVQKIISVFGNQTPRNDMYEDIFRAYMEKKIIPQLKLFL